MENIVVGITGASGALYAQHLLQALCKLGYHIHLALSDAGALVMKHELGIDFPGAYPHFTSFFDCPADHVTVYHNADMSATIASGRYPIKAMVIVPCSMNTLCSIAHGIANNLIQRAASISIKEGRKLVVVPRETPLSSIHLEAMLKLSSTGVCILPAMPGFYHHPKTIDDQVNFVVAKILDVLGIPHTLMPEWHGDDFVHVLMQQEI
ncbi:MAG: aromatic acid decarboxylase [Candidatus Brocadia sp.]|nr:UbiX family flavin prenyltransferase [Candidatus Brocadia sp. AMX3]MDG5996621.1 UbiX family flavin prenyltransferase [Candidatus Brocadia sp.]OQZ01474.1 MAG: aromatic acid decarboxylase [Candidatus Brocadia sp. UTAMX2]RIJ90727.1 MAG: aromatic acid decarboxylase [Candidatus Brocadia sp.]UJS21807.1 MAG: UbiX family flavin prenyltransferase [Candidatus Brocadia sp.]